MFSTHLGQPISYTGGCVEAGIAFSLHTSSEEMDNTVLEWMELYSLDLFSA